MGVKGPSLPPHTSWGGGGGIVPCCMQEANLKFDVELRNGLGELS
jgi:hypothetical protein